MLSLEKMGYSGENGINCANPENLVLDKEAVCVLQMASVGGERKE